MGRKKARMIMSRGETTRTVDVVDVYTGTLSSLIRRMKDYYGAKGPNIDPTLDAYLDSLDDLLTRMVDEILDLKQQVRDLEYHE